MEGSESTGDDRADHPEPVPVIGRSAHSRAHRRRRAARPASRARPRARGERASRWSARRRTASGGDGDSRAQSRSRLSRRADAGVDGFDVVKEVGVERDAADDLRHGVRPVRARSVRRRCARLPRQAVRRRAIRAGIPARAHDRRERESGPLRERSCSRACSDSRQLVRRSANAEARRPLLSADAPRAARGRDSRAGETDPVVQIDYISAAGPYAELHVANRRHVIRETMQTLEERSIRIEFMRVHRSVIVRLELIEALQRGAGGDDELPDEGRRTDARQPHPTRRPRALARDRPARLNPVQRRSRRVAFA